MPVMKLAAFSMSKSIHAPSVASWTRKCREAETDELGANESLKADPILWALSYVCMYIRLVVLLEMAPGSFGIYVNIHMKLFKRARYYLARHHTFMSSSHLFPRPCYP